MVATKDPRLVEAGLRGSQKRWGPRRRLNLGDLPPEARRAILEYVEAQRQAHARPIPADTDAVSR